MKPCFIKNERLLYFLRGKINERQTLLIKCSLQMFKIKALYKPGGYFSLKWKLFVDFKGSDGETGKPFHILEANFYKKSLHFIKIEALKCQTPLPHHCIVWFAF